MHCDAVSINKETFLMCWLKSHLDNHSIHWLLRSLLLAQYSSTSAVWTPLGSGQRSSRRLDSPFVHVFNTVNGGSNPTIHCTLSTWSVMHMYCTFGCWPIRILEVWKTKVQTNKILLYKYRESNAWTCSLKWLPLHLNLHLLMCLYLCCVFRKLAVTRNWIPPCAMTAAWCAVETEAHAHASVSQSAASTWNRECHATFSLIVTVSWWHNHFFSLANGLLWPQFESCMYFEVQSINVDSANY